jgi:RNase H-fold protein (predicted Holliday junction resolvase)
LQNQLASDCKRKNAWALLDNHLAFVSQSSINRHHSTSNDLASVKIKLSQTPDTTTSTKLTPQQEAELTIKFSTLRSLGIDYGLSRTGLAVTTGGYRPRPLTILSGYTKQYIVKNTSHVNYIPPDKTGEEVVQYNNTRLCEAIVTYAQSERVTNLVLGMPLHKNGTTSDQSLLTKQFGMELLSHVRKECGSAVNVTMWDERYTSKEAASRIVGEMIAKNRDLGAINLEGCLDDEAACIILEHYYQVLGKDAEVLVLPDIEEEECRRVYELKLDWMERRRKEGMEGRERLRDARKEMIERDRLDSVSGGGSGGGTKKKRKKKK